MGRNRIPLVGLELRVRGGARDMLHDMADLLEQQIYDNVSLTDHSLEDLNRLGNPYGFTNPRQIDSEPYLVHHQHAQNTGKAKGHKKSTDLIDAVKVRVVNQYRILVGIDDELAPHFRDIFWGTPTMRARDPITPAFETVRDELRRVGADRFKGIIQQGDVGR